MEAWQFLNERAGGNLMTKAKVVFVAILTLFLAAGAQAEPGRKFLWTELIAFDNAKADYGVGEYLSRMSVKPEGISFLVFDPELFHSHTDLSQCEDPCARTGRRGQGPDRVAVPAGRRQAACGRPHVAHGEDSAGGRRRPAVVWRSELTQWALVLL